ncbi:hypothetical protein OF83DRAFT_1142143 [Amylostereum chailletii]|nr:hypothetical protein OF83DRAFT_1142143 [Amylostereum chailletii]
MHARRLAHLSNRRCFSTTSPSYANRAIVYSENGSPPSVVRALSYPTLSAPAPGTLNLRVVLAPINPSDINVVEGVYPSKPSPTTFPGSSESLPLFVGGNEGLAEVQALGSGAESSGLKAGDWVIITRPQSGTWSSARNVRMEDVLKVPRRNGLSAVHAATMTVNPPTAYNMLRDFIELKAGDWVVQNGANSAVGQAIIQIARSRGLNTINLVRPRDDITSLTQELEALGGTHVVTYDELAEKSIKSRVQEWTGGKAIRLGLNCVSGEPTTHMARLLGQDAHLVSYGAMSKQPLSLPTSLYIFKNLKSHGFWQSRWYDRHSRKDRERLVEELVRMMSEGQLAGPKHEVVTIDRGESDSEATRKVRDVFAKISEGTKGTKVLLHLEETDD